MASFDLRHLQSATSLRKGNVGGDLYGAQEAAQGITGGKMVTWPAPGGGARMTESGLENDDNGRETYTVASSHRDSGTSSYGIDNEEEDAERDYGTEETTDGLRPEVRLRNVIGSATREEGVRGRTVIRQRERKRSTLPGMTRKRRSSHQQRINATTMPNSGRTERSRSGCS